VDFGSANRRKLGFFAPQIFRGTYMNTSIGDRLLQDIPRRVAKFRENGPRRRKIGGRKKRKNIFTTKT